MSNYLSIFRMKAHRSIMAKFRCSNHSLAMETGRHGAVSWYVEREDRIYIHVCNICAIN